MSPPVRALAIVCCLALWDLAALPSVAAPPKVIKAVPDNGDVDVDPGLREIRITFDQPMSPGGQSIVGGGDTFPELRDKQMGAWRGSRTFVLPVRLKPNHSYWLSVNSDKFQNFRNRKGEPAVPYAIQFTTGAGGPAMDEEASSAVGNGAAVDQLIQAIITQYSYRDRLGIDWAALVESQRGPLAAAEDAQTFARLAATLLAKAQDKHLWLKVGDQTLPTYVRPVTPNMNARLLPRLVPQWKQDSSVLASGRWDDGIGYLRIDSWDRAKTKELAPIFAILERLKDAPALIIDVRLNSGGDERIARSVAGCFIDQPTVYAKHVLVDPDQPGGFSEPHERMLQPNDRRTGYRGQIVVLTGPVNISSCEAFLLMMKQVPGAQLIGAASQGSSGNPQPYDLGNGVTVFLPCWKAMLPDGTEFEGQGIQPDIAVPTTAKDFERGDPVLEAALTELRATPSRR